MNFLFVRYVSVEKMAILLTENLLKPIRDVLDFLVAHVNKNMAPLGQMTQLATLYHRYEKPNNWGTLHSTLVLIRLKTCCSINT